MRRSRRRHASVFLSITVNGQAHEVALHDKPLPMEGPCFVDVHYATPSRLPAEVRHRVMGLAAAACRAVGVGVGAAPTEFRIQEDGAPKILETAARLGGGPVYQSVLLSTGIDMVEVLTKVSLGESVDIFVNDVNARHVGFSLHFGEQPGELVAVEGTDALEADESVSEVMVYSPVGALTDVPPRVGQAHGHVVFTGTSRDGIIEKQRQVNETLWF